MSFKTSVLIWFSRSCGTASPPAPLLQRGGRLKGWGFCVRQKNIGFEDMVTEEHKTLVTQFFDRKVLIIFITRFYKVKKFNLDIMIGGVEEVNVLFYGHQEVISYFFCIFAI